MNKIQGLNRKNQSFTGKMDCLRTRKRKPKSWQLEPEISPPLTLKTLLNVLTNWKMGWLKKSLRLSKKMKPEWFPKPIHHSRLKMRFLLNGKKKNKKNLMKKVVENNGMESTSYPQTGISL